MIYKYKGISIEANSKKEAIRKVLFMEAMKNFKESDCFLYGKANSDDSFKGVSIEQDGSILFTDSVMFITMICNSKEKMDLLQSISDRNKDINLVFQLRDKITKKVIFQTV